MTARKRQPTLPLTPGECRATASPGDEDSTSPKIVLPENQAKLDDRTAPSTAMQMTLSRRRLADLRDRGWLVVIAGTAVGEMHSLHEGITVLGRKGGGSAICIDDPGVSRRHASITRSDVGGYLLEDLESLNGTFVGEVPIKLHELSDGDRIGLGQATVLKFTLQDQLEEEFQKQLYESSVRDPLTRIFNRKHLMERLLSELAFAKRHGTTVTLVLVDLDHFKQVNDEHGHLAGDTVLRTVAQALERLVRTEDIVARYGGEEIAILARGIDRESGRMLGERVRRSIEQLEIKLPEDTLRVTASVGVGFFEHDDNVGSAEELIARADERLYEAKRTGRNRTVM